MLFLIVKYTQLYFSRNSFKSALFLFAFFYELRRVSCSRWDNGLADYAEAVIAVAVSRLVLLPASVEKKEGLEGREG